MGEAALSEGELDPVIGHDWYHHGLRLGVLREVDCVGDNVANLFDGYRAVISRFADLAAIASDEGGKL